MTDFKLFSVMIMTIVMTGCMQKDDSLKRKNSFDDKLLYTEKITFKTIGVDIKFDERKLLFRDDGYVDDLDIHKKKLLDEFHIPEQLISVNEEPDDGRHLIFSLSDGTVCSIIWVKKSDNPHEIGARAEKQKYLVLAKIAPEKIINLNRKINEQGYKIDLREHEDKISSSIVEALSFHLYGNPWGDLIGNEMLVVAKNILTDSKIDRTKSAEFNNIGFVKSID